MGENVK